ncbi:MAG: S-layer homology domain-containing protein [Candidatus Blackburnbacteria bacterium]|nr:S-layer homology domain-containing protein [Candidatus Blackburnbacteria bacterium]
MPDRFFAQKGIAHIAVIFIVILATAAAAWFFTSKRGLKLPQLSESSKEEKITSLKPKPFKDVSANNKNYTAIKYLAREGLLEADNNGNFNPESILTKSEWAVMLTKLSGVTPDKETYKDCFTDISTHQHEAEICYAKEQGWLNEVSEKQSFQRFRFIKPVNAQQTKENFNPDAPVKDAEAAGSLSRLMEWEPGRTLTDEKAQTFAKEKNILNAKASNLTKGEAAETMYRSVATVSFGQEKYTPAIDEAVSRQKIGSLMDSLTINREAQAREEWVRVRDSAIKNFAEGSEIGYKTATEIVDSSKTREEALKKVREYRYNQWLTGRTSGGRTLEQADIFKAAQQFISARGGQQLTLDDISLSKRSDPAADRQKTSDPTFSEGQSISMIIPLDKDFRMLTSEQRKNGGSVRYMLDISAGDLFYWDDQNSGHVFVELINIETGVIERARVSEIDNFKSIDEMLNSAISQIEADIGRRITPVDAQTDPDCRKIFDSAMSQCTKDYNACSDACSEKTKKPDGTTYFNSGEIYTKCMKASGCHEKSSACGDKALEDYRACVRSVK